MFTDSFVDTDLKWKFHAGKMLAPRVFPNQACLWGSYRSERILVSAGREDGFPIMQDWFPQGIWELGNPEILDFAPWDCGRKHGFRTPCLIKGQTFQGVGLKLTAFILTFRDPSSHLCQKNMRMAESGDLDFGSCSIFPNHFSAII